MLTFPSTKNHGAMSLQCVPPDARGSMSTPSLRRADRAMTAAQIKRSAERGFSRLLATVGQGWRSLLHPASLRLDYCRGVPAHRQHPGPPAHQCRAHPRARFEVDAPDRVFDYCRFECDSGLAYRSVVLFGRTGRRRSDATSRRLRSADEKTASRTRSGQKSSSRGSTPSRSIGRCRAHQRQGARVAARSNGRRSISPGRRMRGRREPDPSFRGATSSARTAECST